jgi:DNA polymerase-3 subunit delta'
MNLAINPETQKILRSIKNNMPQSLLLTGESGVGLFTIARELANDVLVMLQPINSKNEIDDENGLISVEMIRRLHEQTRSKQTKAQIVLINNADRMSNGAQAAFLKLLEEPNPHIHLILTSHHPQKILPTVHSRVVHCIVRPITKEQTQQYLKILGVNDAKKEAQLMFIAEGLPAELFRLVNDEAYFTKKAAYMSDARDFLKSQAYEKMRLVHKYKSDREASITLIDSALRILRRSLSMQPQSTIITQLEMLLEIRENLLMNFAVSLQLARFVL